MDYGYFIDGLMNAITPLNLLFVFLGGLLGTIVGMLPGLGPATGVAVLIPVTFGMEPISAMILLIAIYYGAMYGGSRSSILLNTPGDASAIAASFDGYPMAKKGQAGQALAIATIASLVGGTVAVIGFTFLAGPLADFAIRFGPAEYFLLMLFTLSAIVSLSRGDMLKGFISMLFGLVLSTIGVDAQSSVYRFTMGLPQLAEGIDFLIVIIGIYAVGEVLYNFIAINRPPEKKNKVESLWFTREQWNASKLPIFRSAPLGFIVGVLPGAGGSIASMLGYTTERQLSRTPERFGQGTAEGVAAPESANNSASVGALIPLLSMGIPGSGTTAVLLGALVMLGIQPGPLLFESEPTTIWTLINSMFIGNLFLVVINILLVGLLIKVLDTPSNILYPLILMLGFIGAYTLSYSTIDFYILLAFGVLGLAFKLLRFPIAPLILALIVGHDMEQNFRKSLIVSDGSASVFFSSPISVVLIIMIILSISVPFILSAVKNKKAKQA
ncbi:transporter [Marinococcus halophilus]|uniref:Tripartite tricarboxylate transporter TctA n=1 Tax=Marinococcus halophilus TaxID=1371 RepID=A0A510Y2R0_MARHA|nr:tripartite tricarboxylate transporter permease [Marinococcus halophilus]OZT81671.1 transporter [Marinococcus halophilus]GEK57620.1 tripartite tricarboxylate transporter TctA [Marinococcus halophilus]